MLKLVIPLVLGLIGAGGGIAAGIYLKPEPEEMVELGPCGEDGQYAMKEGDADHAMDDGHAEEADHAADKAKPGSEPASDTEFVKLNNQFVVPVLTGERVSALVVLSLSLETRAGGQEAVYQREPKLRDSFLQVLFDHANAGGFSGAFTSGDRLPTLRRSLLQAARIAVGDLALDVLVTDIARQDT